MGVALDVFSFINALPDAVLILDKRRGKVVAANEVFFKFTGFAKGVFQDTPFYKLPFNSKEVRHGLLRLFFKASREDGGGSYVFAHVCPNGSVMDVYAYAVKAVLGEGEYIVFSLKQAMEQTAEDDADSLKFYKALAYEPYMEFRPNSHVPVVEEQENRMVFLQMLGESLRVKFSNSAADKFYQGSRGSLEGQTFLSLFNRESDAIRFLDMLAAVGQMRAETTVNTYKDFAVQVEMNCMVKFDDDDDAIAVLYCSQRDLSGYQRYKTIIGDSRFEMEFMFNQPFLGFAFLVPPHPLERPKIENLDATLDEMLNRITVVRANQAMTEIYETDKSKFLMKPMVGLFYDPGAARQVLKELFVMRETSFGTYKVDNEEGCDRVSICRATFDDADRLTGIFVVSSSYNCGYHPRHTGAQPSGTEAVKAKDSAESLAPSSEKS